MQQRYITWFFNSMDAHVLSSILHKLALRNMQILFQMTQSRQVNYWIYYDPNVRHCWHSPLKERVALRRGLRDQTTRERGRLPLVGRTLVTRRRGPVARISFLNSALRTSIRSCSSSESCWARLRIFSRKESPFERLLSVRLSELINPLFLEEV